MRGMFVLAACLLSFSGVAQSAEPAADKSHPRSLDPDLKITLFAEQPTIVTPTGIDVDDKGRVFAIESNTHFPPKGYSRHKTDRVLILQDTDGDEKADKVTVFTDGLTHAMSVKVRPLWLDFHPQPTAKRSDRRQSRRLGMSVYLATRRDIWLYHDDDGDGKADRREQIVHLETPGNYPHNGLAGIAFDAMGWMYFGFGENLGAKYTLIGSDGRKFSGGGEGGNLYRCQPDGSKLTRWATGFWNPHASCVDAFGRLFTVDNDPDSRPPCRLLHIIEGGDYGYRFRNGRKGLHPFTAWNGEIPGTLPMVSGTGEAPSGIVAYESDGLPERYIGNLLVTSWGDHRIDRFVLKAKGASFVSRPETIIQGGEDFRPVGLAVAPDGSLFCTDWVKRDYKLHGHGRVWRISRTTPTSRARQEAGTAKRDRQTKEAKRKHPLPDGRGSSKKRVIDLSSITPNRPVKELTKLLSHPRLDVRRMAARALRLHEREGLALLAEAYSSKSNSTRTKAEIWWQVIKSPKFKYVFGGRQILPDVAKLPRPLFNILIKTLVSRRDVEAQKLFGATCLSALGEDDPAETMLRKRLLSNSAWILSLRRINWNAWEGKPGETVRVAISRLVATNDPFQMVAFVGSVSQSPCDRFFLQILESPQTNLHLLATLVLRRAVPRNAKAIVSALHSNSPDVRRVAVQWVAEENLQQLRPQVEAVLNSRVMNADLFLATLAALEMLDGKNPKDFDKTPAGKYVLPIVRDSQRPAAVRAVALRLVSPDEKTLDEKLFRELLAVNDLRLKTEAVRTLSLSQHSFAGLLLLEVATNEQLPLSLRADALAGLYGHWFNSKEGNRILQELLKFTASKEPALQIEALRSARVLLTKTAKGGAVRVRLQRQLQAAVQRNPKLFENDSPLRHVAEQLELAYREANRPLPAVLQPIRQSRPQTPAGWYVFAAKRGGDAEAGRRIFFHANSAGCYKCHTVNGRGGKVGPDLTYIARTMDRHKLAESILEPSREIAPQFTLWTFVMADGKIHHGLILGDTRGNVQRIGTAEGRVVELPADEIELRKPQDKSVMPAQLVDRLTASEFRDLLAFLETLK